MFLIIIKNLNEIKKRREKLLCITAWLQTPTPSTLLHAFETEILFFSVKNKHTNKSFIQLKKTFFSRSYGRLIIDEELKSCVCIARVRYDFFLENPAKYVHFIPYKSTNNITVIHTHSMSAFKIQILVLFLFFWIDRIDYKKKDFMYEWHIHTYYI